MLDSLSAAPIFLGGAAQAPGPGGARLRPQSASLGPTNAKGREVSPPALYTFNFLTYL